jgi:hypothetical protein
MMMMMTMITTTNPKADLDRLYVKRKEGGRGLVQVEVAHKTEIINIAEYLNTNYKGDHLVHFVKNHKSTLPNMNSTIKLAAKITEDLSDAEWDEIQHTKSRLGKVLKKGWKNNTVHEQYIWNIGRQLLNEEDTFLWLMKGELKTKTESEIVAAQDQALRMK